MAAHAFHRTVLSSRNENAHTEHLSHWRPHAFGDSRDSRVVILFSQPRQFLCSCRYALRNGPNRISAHGMGIFSIEL
jgi:hypothetical protein